MAVTIVATAGGASSNSFVTLAEADAYMEGRLNSTLWDAATDDSKNRALVEATRELSAMSWCGLRVDDTQALSWPRQLAINPDDPSTAYYETTEIPDRVKWATEELAFEFIRAGTTDVAALDASTGIKREKVDVIEVEYDTVRVLGGVERYPRVVNWIAPLLNAPVGGGLNVPVIRG